MHLLTLLFQLIAELCLRHLLLRQRHINYHLLLCSICFAFACLDLLHTACTVGAPALRLLQFQFSASACCFCYLAVPAILRQFTGSPSPPLRLCIWQPYDTNQFPTPCSTPRTLPSFYVFYSFAPQAASVPTPCAGAQSCPGYPPAHQTGRDIIVFINESVAIAIANPWPRRSAERARQPHDADAARRAGHSRQVAPREARLNLPICVGRQRLLHRISQNPRFPDFRHFCSVAALQPRPVIRRTRGAPRRPKSSVGVLC